ETTQRRHRDDTETTTKRRHRDDTETTQRRHKDDIAYMVYALNLHLQQFRERPEMARILQEQGQKGLPAVFINDQLVLQGKYPEMDELEKLILSADS
ncbi:MAG: arsenic metallochaperone ArsD family protein, partial [Thermodesulfobacteriota bacterium]